MNDKFQFIHHDFRCVVLILSLSLSLLFTVLCFVFVVFDSPISLQVVFIVPFSKFGCSTFTQFPIKLTKRLCVIFIHIYDNNVRFAVVVQKKVIIHAKFPERNGKYFRCLYNFNVVYESLESIRLCRRILHFISMMILTAPTAIWFALL